MMNTNRGDQGQSGASAYSWAKKKDKLGQVGATAQHWWHSA